jgi:carbon-monoxide dehydrogenase large subunit
MDAIDDTGVRNIDMPLLPDRVWHAMKYKRDISGMPPVGTDDS